MKPIWTEYELVINVGQLAGGIPKDPRLVEAWQQSRAHKLVPPDTVEAAIERTLASLDYPDPDTGGWTGFPYHPDTKELCIESRQVKAMLKESANICKELIPIHGKIIPLRSKLAERVFVQPQWIPLGPSRTEPDRTVERAIHVMTRQGPRDALKREDICDNVTLVCMLRVLADGMFTAEVLSTLLDHASENGLGADRSQGLGQFTYRLTPC